MTFDNHNAPLTKSRIAIIGTGYVGLTTGACFAKLGHTVICADVIPEKVESLQKGQIPILEDGLGELVQDGIKSGRLSFVVGAANAAANCEYAYMCLPTPQGADGAADLSYLISAAQEIADILPAGAIVVNKSTVPAGSAQRVADVINREDIEVASNPEFLREGTAVLDFFKPDRIVIGARRTEVSERVAALYSGIPAPKLLVDTSTAELIKYASNAFLAAKISFANSISNLCEAVGANAHEVLNGMGYDNRIGSQFLKPGPGWGGSCFPKDVVALIHTADQYGYDFDLLKAVVETNELQIRLMVEKVKSLFDGNLKHANIAVWGLTFKAGTDDMRESPAIKIVDQLLHHGANITAYDPGSARPVHGISQTVDALSACKGADMLVILTEWPEFGQIPVEHVAKHLRHKRLLDTRNVIDVDQLDAHGFEYHSVGYGVDNRTSQIA